MPSMIRNVAMMGNDVIANAINNMSNQIDARIPVWEYIYKNGEVGPRSWWLIILKEVHLKLLVDQLEYPVQKLVYLHKIISKY